MEQRKVMVILGTRPEAIKLAPVILELQKNTSQLVPLVCVTGQHREMLHQVLEWFAIQPDLDLNLMQANQDLSSFAARALTALGSAIREAKPDAVLVQGDTTTALMGALAAFYERVPVGHVEAGLRTRDLYNPFPEELNRRAIAVLAKYHFAPTEEARKALLAEQINEQNIFWVGNTVVDALRLTMEAQASRKRNRETETTESVSAEGRRLVLVTAHRRESFGSPFDEMCQAIRTIADHNDNVEIVYPVHLNPNVRDPVSRLLSGHKRIRLVEPLRYEQFVHLMSHCHLILTDSGGIQEEAAVLGIPTLVMRNTTERPEAVSSGTATLVGTSREAIVTSAERLLRNRHADETKSLTQSPFGDGFSAQRIVGILAQQL